MTRSRRAFLGGASALLASSLAGCVNEPDNEASLSVGVREPFENAGEVTLPLTVSIALEAANTPSVGLQGVTVGCYDERFVGVGARPLGVFTWEGADPENRSKERGLIQEGTAYLAEWELDLGIEAESTPEWIAIEIERAWVSDGGSTDDEAGVQSSSGGTIGDLRLRVYASKYVGPRPPPPTVVPGDYESMYVDSRYGRRTGAGRPLVPHGYHPDRQLQELEVRLDEDRLVSGGRTKVEVWGTFVGEAGRRPVRGATIRSTDRSVATVEDGWVTARQPGSVQIEAMYRGQSVRADLRVVERGTDSSR